MKCESYSGKSLLFLLQLKIKKAFTSLFLKRFVSGRVFEIVTYAQTYKGQGQKCFVQKK